MNLEIRDFELPPIGTNAYVVIDGSSSTCVAIDAPLNAFATVERILVKEGLKLEALLLTHGHWDHMLDGWRFNEFGTPVFAHEADQRLLSEPALMSAFSLPGLEMKPVEVSTWVGQGQKLNLLGRTVEVREVPGHCPGSVLYWFSEDEVAFSGDALFRGSIGRYDLPGGDFNTLETSIQSQIYTLPENTRIFPGHGPETSVGHERTSNPFVRG